MPCSVLSKPPSAMMLRQFAGLWTVFFAALACWQGFLVGNLLLAWICAIAAMPVGLLGLLKPEAVRPVFTGWLTLMFPIGWVISHLILACVFYLVFTPLGLFFKVMGRDPLARKPRSDQPTYWMPKTVAADPRSYFRPF